MLSLLSLAQFSLAVSSPFQLPLPLSLFLSQISQEDIEEVKVDWFFEVQEGGIVAMVLILLIVALLAFAIERLFSIRLNRISPKRFRQTADRLWQRGEFDSLLRHAKKDGSILANAVRFIVEHRENSRADLKEGVSDMAAREIEEQYEKLAPISIIAAIAPLLGLLGTMIGMIEAFQLVAVFGDDGGASMLAGSISKALITTAMGLVIAIPAMIIYHFFKRRLHRVSKQLEVDLESLINGWYLYSSTRDYVGTSPTVHAETQVATPEQPVQLQPEEAYSDTVTIADYNRQ